MFSHGQHPVYMDQEIRARFGKLQSSHEPFDAPQSVERVRLADSLVCGTDLAEAIQDALRSVALATQRDGTNGEPDERGRTALNLVCELGRRDELLIEQLLVLLKDGWRHLPEVQSVARTEAADALARVITHCIKEFHRPSRRG